jgi:hypothetical protein
VLAKIPKILSVFLDPKIFQDISHDDRRLRDRLIRALGGKVTDWDEGVKKVTVDGFKEQVTK